ncbi:hypothetical protein EIN_078980 [Entamoeba invadens IP1]|uniref:Uncharacterized protein n=1 Tax=Entamoeba invadens TaxID=33085 RepID=S0B1G5_ENTIV|nr:hypothetical protein EIN_078980 [Entamoeba invadens IP1]ELP84996.1 hypothetical protein EIN_078980 [Entamoeba invadens IP1]BAN41635.1 hypothetical protein [Entamoeba invadens]|eukprot:XP_004184342.1 hypothetical protein EIN_078980 [Entamoeba invadens IP1]
MKSLKTFQKEVKRLVKAMNGIKATKSKSFFKLTNPEDALKESLSKVDQMFESDFIQTAQLTPEITLDLLSLWANSNEFILRLPHHTYTLDVFKLIHRIINIKQIQPIALADFPAPDEMDPTTEKILEIYFNNTCKTTLFLLFALNGSSSIRNIVEQNKKRYSPPIGAIPKVEHTKTLSFYRSVEGLNSEYTDIVAKILVEFTMRIPGMYELILEKVDTFGSTSPRKSVEILREEVKMEFPSFRKWESFGNFVSSKNSRSKSFGESIYCVEQYWLLHFEARSEFAIRYYKYWAEYAQKDCPKDAIETYPGFSIFKKELTQLFVQDKATSLSIGNTLAAFGILEEDGIHAILNFRFKDQKSRKEETEKIVDVYKGIFSYLKEKGISTANYNDLPLLDEYNKLSA